MSWDVQAAAEAGRRGFGIDGVMTADRPSTYTPKTALLPGKDVASPMVPMPVARRRFRTTVATAPTVRPDRRPLRPRAPAVSTVLALAACACLTAKAADPVPATRARRLLAAGEQAAERGWLVAARDHWRDAAAAAERVGDTTTRSAAVAHLSRLDSFVHGRPPRECIDRDAALWSADDWRPVWRLPAAGRPADAGPPMIAGGLVVWSTGRAVHAVRLCDGATAWPVGDPRDTRLFPREVSPGDVASADATERGRQPPAGGVLPVVLSTAGRCFAVLGGERLVCLDLSDPAQGRLVWSVIAAAVPHTPPRTRAMFTGPPTVDDELCGIVLRRDDGRGSLALAMFDARDGSLRWSHDLGPSVAEGIDGLRVGRRPCFAEDRVVVDTLAGAVRGFDRDGAAIWTLATPPPTAGGGASLGERGMLCTAGRLILPAADGSTITAVEPRTGTSTWQWQAGETRVLAMFGTADGGLLIATRRDDDAPQPTTLLRLALDDGRPSAAWTTDGTPAGIGTLADASVIWPVGRRTPAGGDAIEIEVLDAVTLDRRRPPIDSGLTTPARGLAVADGSIVCADGGVTCLRPTSALGHDIPSR
jgi:outer membrane protein assembly factor BamB